MVWKAYIWDSEMICHYVGFRESKWDAIKLVKARAGQSEWSISKEPL